MTVFYAEPRYAKRRYTECRKGAFNAVCHYAECHYADCRGAQRFARAQMAYVIIMTRHGQVLTKPLVF
jgi:hypothetical protein